MKKLYYLFGALALVVALSGCGKDQPTTPDTTEQGSNSGSDNNGGGSDNNGGGSDNNGNVDPKTAEMSADEQKNYLIQVAQAFMGKFKTQDQQAAISLVDGMIHKMDVYDWSADGFENYYEQRLENEVEAMFVVPRYIRNIVSGETSATSPMVYSFSLTNRGAIFEANERTRNWDYLQASDHFEARFLDYDGNSCVAKVWGEGAETTHEFTYYICEKAQQREYYLGSETATAYAYVGEGHGDYTQGEWAYDSNYGGYTYSYSYTPGTGSYQLLTWSDVPADNRYSSYQGYWEGEEHYSYYGYATYTYWRNEFSERPEGNNYETKTIQATLPERIRFQLKQGNTEVCNATISIRLQENDHYNFSYLINLLNIQFNMAANVSHQAANTQFCIKVDNEEVLSASANLPTYSVATKSNSQTYEEYGENLYDRWESILNTTGQVTAEVNIMKRVQVKAIVSNAGNAYNAFNDWSNAHEGDQINEIETRASAEELANLISRYGTASMYYSSDVEQAKVQVRPYADSRQIYHYDGNNSYYTTKNYYTLESVLYFPKDGTSYAYETYFSENRFSNVLDMAEDLTNSYLRAFQYQDFGTVDF